MKPQTVKKDDLLKRWASMKREKSIVSVMRPLPYKHEGSTYGNDGIRIDGSLEFVEAVLSHLTSLIALEAVETRLSVSLSEVASREKTQDGVKFGDGTGSWCCYIRCAERGNEGKRVAAFTEYARSETA